MNDLLDLQMINNRAPAGVSQGEKPASKQGAEPEAFKKVLNDAAAEQPSGGPPKEKEIPKVTGGDKGDHPVVFPSGSPPIDAKESKRSEPRDEKPEADPSSKPLDPALIPPVGLASLQVGFTPNSPVEGTPLSQAVSLAEKSLGFQQTSQTKLFVSGGVDVKALNEMKSPENRSNPIAPSGQEAKTMATPIPVPSELMNRSDGPPLTSKELHLMLEKTLAKKPDTSSEATPHTVETPNGAGGTGTDSLKVESVGRSAKEDRFSSTFSDVSRKDSGPILEKLQAAPTNLIATFAKEMGGMGAGGISSSMPQMNRSVESGVQSTGSAQSKAPTDALPMIGMPNQQQLLQQIAEKWSLSHSNHEHSFRLQLEPEALGPLQIDVSVHQERVVADIVTKHPFVKDLLDGNQEWLRGMLANHGMKVDRFSVNVGNPGEGSFGLENRFRQSGSDSPYSPSLKSFFSSAERGDVSTEPRWSKGGARSAINIYV